MDKMQDFIVKSKEIFIGLEDAKRSWKIAVRCDKMLIHQTMLPMDKENLVGYIRNRYPACRVHLLYETGFHGFWLHDFLRGAGILCGACAYGNGGENEPGEDGPA
jgi:transposase